MAWIAFTRKNIWFRFSALLLACSFVAGCAQGPKAYFANVWSSGRDGASNLAQKMTPWKNSEEDKAIAGKDGEENGIQTVSVQESEDKTGSVFSSWVRKGSQHEKIAADPFLNQSWVKKARKENANKKNKVINVSRETTDEESLALDKDSKSKDNSSERDKLLEGIGPSEIPEEDTKISLDNNEFVDGVDNNLDLLRASLKKDTESNDQLVIPELENDKSKELVEKKMILAETFLVKGDIESARKKALEAQEIIEKENLVYVEDSPEDFLDRISQEENPVAGKKKTSDSFDDFALNDKPLNNRKKKSTKKKSRFNMAFPYNSSSDEWKSESPVSRKSKSSEFDGFTQKARSTNKPDTGMIVDTDSLTERERIREEFKKSRNTKKVQSRTKSNSSEDSWGTSALKQEIKNSGIAIRSAKKNVFKSKTKTGKVEANSHSKIKLASHEKNLLTPMGNMKVKNPVHINHGEIEFLYANEEDGVLDVSNKEIALAPIGDGFPTDGHLKKGEAKRKIGSLAYLISAGLFIFGFVFLFYRKMQKAKLI